MESWNRAAQRRRALRPRSDRRHVALGVVSARVAFLGARDPEDGVPGALRFLLGQAQGARILGAVVAGLAAIALVRFGEAVRGRFGAITRLGFALNGVGYAALAWAAARALFHVRQGGSLEKAGIAWLIGEPWGAGALEIIGAGVIAGGAFEIWQGLRGRAPFSPQLLPRRLARLLSAIARFGFIARGLVLVALGYFAIRAAEELDPGRVRSVGGVLRDFSRTALGPAFMGVVALGLAAYGIYMATLAVLQRKV